MGNQVLRDVVSENISKTEIIYLKLLLITTNSHTSTLGMFVLMELRAEESLSFLCGGIESKPALIVVVEDAGRINAGGCEPSFHRCHGILWRGEHFMDFICGPVLPIF